MQREDWTRILSLLPMILAGAKGGAAGVGGYSQGWLGSQMAGDEARLAQQDRAAREEQARAQRARQAAADAQAATDRTRQHMM